MCTLDTPASRTGTTGRTRLGAEAAPEVLEACRSMAAGDGDFSLAPERRHRKGDTLDGKSTDVWFWGEGNIHGANTF